MIWMCWGSVGQTQQQKEWRDRNCATFSSEQDGTMVETQDILENSSNYPFRGTPKRSGQAGGRATFFGQNLKPNRNSPSGWGCQKITGLGPLHKHGQPTEQGCQLTHEHIRCRFKPIAAFLLYVGKRGLPCTWLVPTQPSAITCQPNSSDVPAFDLLWLSARLKSYCWVAACLPY